MQISFLGGAREIGASSCLLEVEGKNILIDAGIRPSPQEGQSFLPKFQRVKSLDLVLITHAHTDHIGSLPVLLRSYPDVPVVATEATFELMKIILPVSQYVLEIARDTHERANEAAYTDSELDRVFGAVLLTEEGKWFEPFPDRKIKIGFFNAGHILGACVIAIEAEGRKILFSGDFCLRDQKTQAGFKYFNWQPDCLVCESTYADEEHPVRADEETAFCEGIERVLNRNGSVLIPAFAVGRAQEVLLTLAEAMISDRLKKAPIFYDGLVSQALELYERLGHFNTDPRIVIERVRDDRHRHEILETKPAVIVASSGSLSGGASVFYAKNLLPGAENAIFFSGYQDEDSPGGILLNLEGCKERNVKIALDKKAVAVKAEIGRYQFSAHADSKEIAEFVEKLNPKVVVLNHGIWTRMWALTEILRKQRVIWLPSTRTAFDPFTSSLDEFMRLGELQAGKSVQEQVKRGWLALPTPDPDRRTWPQEPVGTRRQRPIKGLERAREGFDLEAALKRLAGLEARIGYTFKNRRLLLEAVTHRSFRNEHRELTGNNNERLEFLGDAVMEYIVTKELLYQFPQKEEGEITNMRGALVNINACYELGRQLSIGDYLLLSRGERKDKGKARNVIIGNTFEALVGAIHEDGGMAACEQFVKKTTLSRVDEVMRLKLYCDPKSTLQEITQDKLNITPVYRVLAQWGPDHSRNFKIGVYVGKERWAIAIGKSKQEAEIYAAAEALRLKCGIAVAVPDITGK